MMLLKFRQNPWENFVCRVDFIPTSLQMYPKFGCSIESNSQNGTEKMKMLRSEFPFHQSLLHERKIFQTDNYRAEATTGGVL